MWDFLIEHFPLVPLPDAWSNPTMIKLNTDLSIFFVASFLQLFVIVLAIAMFCHFSGDKTLESWHIHLIGGAFLGVILAFLFLGIYAIILLFLCFFAFGGYIMVKHPNKYQ